MTIMTACGTEKGAAVNPSSEGGGNGGGTATAAEPTYTNALITNACVATATAAYTYAESSGGVPKSIAVGDTIVLQSLLPLNGLYVGYYFSADGHGAQKVYVPTSKATTTCAEAVNTTKDCLVLATTTFYSDEAMTTKACTASSGTLATSCSTSATSTKYASDTKYVGSVTFAGTPPASCPTTALYFPVEGTRLQLGSGNVGIIGLYPFVTYVKS